MLDAVAGAAVMLLGHQVTVLASRARGRRGEAALDVTSKDVGTPPVLADALTDVFASIGACNK